MNNLSHNKNIGKYDLLFIWDEVLFNTSELKSPLPISSYSICHLAITSINMAHHTVAQHLPQWLFHMPPIRINAPITKFQMAQHLPQFGRASANTSE